MGRSFYIITGLIGFLVGVGLYLVVQPSLLALLGFSLVCVLFLVGDAHVRPVLTSKYGSVLRVALVLVLAVCAGLLRASFSEHRLSSDQIDFYNGNVVLVEGVIVETDVRREKAKYTVQVDAVNEDSYPHLQEVEGSLLISLDKYPRYAYGDRIKVYGELQEPGSFDGFSYSNYLSRYGIYSVMYYPRVERVGTGEGSLFWRVMSTVQNRFLSQINRVFPEPHASFEAGLLVGARKGIPPELMERFNITGLTHIIAISGYNITIIIVFVMWALKGLPRRVRFIIALISIVLFTLFVGASPAVVRASIMGILGLIALQHGRQNNIHITVLFSAFFMVLWNPKILWWDVGFQLSFAAVMGLIYVAPLFERYAEKLPTAFGVREAIQMTLSAQVMALPIIIFNFERLSLIAPLANLLVIFAIPPAMLFGFVAVLFSFVFEGVALIFGYITWGILSYIIQVIDWMASVPFASVNLPGMKFGLVLIYYLALGVFLILYSKWRKGPAVAK